MKVKGNKVFIWELIGFFFIITFGTLFHFFYDWSGKSSIVGLFAPVNESIWEHLKLGFWSIAIFSIIEYKFIKEKVNNFIIAKAAGLIVIELFIVIFYYSYISLVGKNSLFLNILSYVLGALFCQIISYQILLKRKLNDWLRVISISFIIIFGILLMVFTYFTPELPIFFDKSTNKYGVKWK